MDWLNAEIEWADRPQGAPDRGLVQLENGWVLLKSNISVTAYPASRIARLRWLTAG